jgi:ribosomal protein L13
MKTFTATPADISKKWILIDAEGIVLGRLATIVANILRGKNKPTFTPHMDMGDNVIVINADKVQMTGNKRADKVYYWYQAAHGQASAGRRASRACGGKGRRADDHAQPSGPPADDQPARLCRCGAPA